MPPSLPRLPTHAQLRPGTPVNIVLKPDQRTGKLTPGIVAETLTKGDHPRGVKVRLGDGRVGRVQSLAPGGGMSGGSGFSGVGFGRGIGMAGVGGAGEREGNRSGIEGGNGMGNGTGFGASQSAFQPSTMGETTTRPFKLQDDYRNDPVPVEERSLEDYIKVPSRNQKKKKGGRKGTTAAVESTDEGLGGQEAEERGDGGNRGEGGMGGEGKEKSVQEVLEAEFKTLDPALIAAIVADHGGVEGAREVLKGLS